MGALQPKFCELKDDNSKLSPMIKCICHNVQEGEYDRYYLIGTKCGTCINKDLYSVSLMVEQGADNLQTEDRNLDGVPIGKHIALIKELPKSWQPVIRTRFAI
jgi:hypothetical protein